MADVKISALPAVVTPAGTDEFAVNQAGTTKKMTLSQILASGSAAGSFSSVASAGDVSVGSNALASDVRVSVNAAAGQNRALAVLTGGALRWLVQGEDTPEAGSDAGSDLEIVAHDDAGSVIGVALRIVRADLSTILGGTLRATRIGVGVDPSAGAGVLVNPSGLTGTTQVGCDLLPVVGSGATVAAIGARAGVQTAAAAFTVAAAHGLQVVDAVKGAGSTITTLYGLYVAQQTQGATNWGVYVANNKSYFGGEVQITGDLNHDGTNWGLAGATPSPSQTGYTTFTNLSTLRTGDADTLTTAQLADILGTLIVDLKAKGVLNA